jgi:hypothetical protein
MAYAAPGGGILCMELLRLARSESAVADSEITRSSIVQQLSLLVGFLDWVSPSAPNGDLCRSCKTVIQHVLDQTLNSSSKPSDTETEEYDWDFSTNVNLGEYFNFELLDTYEFLRPELLPS